jgi:hypothetical protein
VAEVVAADTVCFLSPASFPEARTVTVAVAFEPGGASRREEGWFSISESTI